MTRFHFKNNIHYITYILNITITNIVSILTKNKLDLFKNKKAILKKIEK